MPVIKTNCLKMDTCFAALISPCYYNGEGGKFKKKVNFSVPSVVGKMILFAFFYVSLSPAILKLNNVLEHIFV